MSADRRDRHVVLVEHALHIERIVIEAHRGRKAGRAEHASAGIGIGDIRAVKPHFACQLQLSVHARVGLDQKKKSDLHGHVSLQKKAELFFGE